MCGVLAGQEPSTDLKASLLALETTGHSSELTRAAQSALPYFRLSKCELSNLNYSIFI